MPEQEDPKLISSHEHTKITTICRTTINEHDQNLPEKIFQNYRHKEGTTTRWVGGANPQYNQVPHPQWGQPTNWRKIVL